MTALAEQLRDAAIKMGRLTVHMRDPERFFVERDEPREMLARLARDADRQGARR